MGDVFLLYKPDPFGVGGSRYFRASAEDADYIQAEQVGDIQDEIITYEAATLIDDLRRNGAQLPSKMIDMSEAIRLLTGLSRADGGEPKWNFWRRIRTAFDNESDWLAIRAMHESREIPESPNEFELFSAFASATASLWSLLKTELEEANESDRFFQVEIPVARIFHARQFKGVSIDASAVDASLKSASNEKYEAYRDVADQLGISPTGLNYWNVSRHLPLAESSVLQEVVKGYALRDQLRISADVSKFAKAFTNLMDASRDVDILTRLTNAHGRTFPTFHSFGTISSRILVSDPYLQELRRRHRKVFSADQGRHLVYFDYSQFEPGIMASLANDDELIQMYNDGDIYAAFSTALYGNADHRDQCKKIFLAFSYGMNEHGIAKLLAGDDSSAADRSAIEIKVTTFFSRFKRLNDFKSALELLLLKDGRISTPMGNRRKRSSSGSELTSRERRWATSQRVQGTASLIFKTALINLASTFGPDAILLPMHDAVLMQFKTDEDTNSNVGQVKEIMAAAFAKWCPAVNARITHGPFS
ncbi:DNA polymerase [Bradyrhizobium sp. cf659]|uniref:DNA polymerase n=1 Tax=Bradyrhizobium sp. cf659 TaxID=1761771 RepID=UPI0008E96D43|nr:DNA polymerase [Bradyrhizobium sp. cf659]SFJ53697.1 DNA polymerase family A [Bradyrhizobium sp. cf659]